MSWSRLLSVFCGVFAIHTDVIMYDNDSRESISDLVHPCI